MNNLLSFEIMNDSAEVFQLMNSEEVQQQLVGGGVQRSLQINVTLKVKGMVYLVVSVLALYSDYSSSNPTQVKSTVLIQ